MEYRVPLLFCAAKVHRWGDSSPMGGERAPLCGPHKIICYATWKLYMGVMLLSMVVRVTCSLHSLGDKTLITSFVDIRLYIHATCIAGTDDGKHGKISGTHTAYDLITSFDATRCLEMFVSRFSGRYSGPIVAHSRVVLTLCHECGSCILVRGIRFQRVVWRWHKPLSQNRCSLPTLTHAYNR